MTDTPNANDGAEKVAFDVTKVEGFISIEDFKWEFPDYDPENPAHERFVQLLAEILTQVQRREQEAAVKSKTVAEER